jgi:hypothetical protein
MGDKEKERNVRIARSYRRVLHSLQIYIPHHNAALLLLSVLFGELQQ